MEYDVNVNPNYFAVFFPGQIQEDPTMGIKAKLSDEHAASSYGQPVLVVGGNAYGPGEIHCTLGEDEESPLVAAWNRAALVVLDQMYPDQPPAPYTGDLSWLDDQV